MTIDRPFVKLLREKLQKKVEELEAEFQLSIHVGNATFSETNVNFKIECAAINDKGEVLDRASEDFKSYARLYGLQPEDLGKSFTWSGDSYTITGLNSRSSKHPIIVERKDGKKFKFSADQIHFSLKRTNPLLR